MMGGDAPVITLLTDYGLDDEFVGVCHGVIARICPAARVIDLTHAITRHDIRGGALALASAMPYLPVGVHLAVVDPGVGGARRAVAVALADGRVLVGPDNGVLSLAAEAAGGVVEATEISHSPLVLEPVSATFHGRDIFAPLAAHLAGGVPLSEAGIRVDPATLIAIELPRPEAGDGRLVATAIHADHFGNVQLAATGVDLGAAGLEVGREVDVKLASGRVHAARLVSTFAEVQLGELIVYEDATGRLALAVSQGSAAAQLGVRRDEQVAITARRA